MNSIKEQLLREFKKANAKRKEVLAKKFGFDSPAAYLSYLEDVDVAPAIASGLESVPEVEPLVDMVIAFDTTGSMRSYIGAVRSHVKDLIPTVFKDSPNLKMKIVAFGDYCDMTKKDVFGDAYQESEFTSDENSLVKFVANAKDTGGGDGDEFYELVIKKIIEETPWREGSSRGVLLIGDANPHEVGYSYSTCVRNNQIDWKKEAQRAKGLDIKFDTLTIRSNDSRNFFGYSSTNWYQELSDITGGNSLPFKSSEKTQEVFAAATYFRGATVGDKVMKAKFTASMAAASVSGDEELIGMYKVFNEKL